MQCKKWLEIWEIKEEECHQEKKAMKSHLQDRYRKGDGRKRHGGNKNTTLSSSNFKLQPWRRNQRRHWRKDFVIKP
jgi:hypothetical protein